MRAATVALAFALASGCERSEPPRRAAPAPAPSETAIAADKAGPLEQASSDVDRETLCSVRDLGPAEDGRRAVEREIYSFPKLNRLLAKHPELARAVGLDQIRTCDDARNFALGYMKFQQAHPDFNPSEGPSKAEQFERIFAEQGLEASPRRDPASTRPRSR